MWILDTNTVNTVRQNFESQFVQWSDGLTLDSLYRRWFIAEELIKPIQSVLNVILLSL